MKNRLFFLFYANLVILFVGYGLFPLLPLYAMEFGATAGAVGIYLGLTYVAISVGSMLPSWLPETVSRKRLFLAASLVGIPALALLGMANSLWQVVLLTAAVWFSGGVGLAVSSVYTGMISNQSEQGRSFSLVSLSTPVASLLGGLIVGQLVATAGYRVMFLALAIWWVSLPLVVFFKLENVQVDPQAERAEETAATAPATGRSFLLLLLAAFLVAGTTSVGRMGASLSMQALSFSPQAVSSTSAAAGLAMIPFILVQGALSDRLGRRHFLTIGYLLSAAGALALVLSGQLWHFWVAMAMLMLGRAVNDSMAAAVATELLPRPALPRALPRLKAMNWVAGVVSFAGAGYAMAALGIQIVFVALALAAVVAALVMALLPRRDRPAPEKSWLATPAAGAVEVRPAAEGC
jgi:MFS family permease